MPCMLLPPLVLQLLGVLRAAVVTDIRSWNGDEPPLMSNVVPLVLALVQLLLLFVMWLLGVVLAVLLPLLFDVAPPSE